MRIGSMCAGIGGLELGLEWAGVGRVAWQVEIDHGCRTVLEKHWPDADRSVTDVRQEAALALPRVDVLCAGIPCQPFSQAGKQRGTEDDRWLWPFVERWVDAKRPSVVVIENVAGFIRRGLDHVVTGLDRLGFDVEASSIAAAHVGAPHLRQRIFVVAYAHGWRWQEQRQPPRQRQPQPLNHLAPRDEPDRCDGAQTTMVANANGGSVRNVEQRQPWGREGELCDGGHAEHGHDGQARGGNTEPGMGRSSDGIQHWLDGSRWPAPPCHERHAWEPSPVIQRGTMKRVAARKKQLGNAVVPQVAYIVGKRIMERT